MEKKETSETRPLSREEIGRLPPRIQAKIAEQERKEREKQRAKKVKTFLIVTATSIAGYYYWGQYSTEQEKPYHENYASSSVAIAPAATADTSFEPTSYKEESICADNVAPSACSAAPSQPNFLGETREENISDSKSITSTEEEATKDEAQSISLKEMISAANEKSQQKQTSLDDAKTAIDDNFFGKLKNTRISMKIDGFHLVSYDANGGHYGGTLVIRKEIDSSAISFICNKFTCKNSTEQEMITKFNHMYKEPCSPYVGLANENAIKISLPMLQSKDIENEDELKEFINGYSMNVVISISNQEIIVPIYSGFSASRDGGVLYSSPIIKRDICINASDLNGEPTLKYKIETRDIGS